jgi:Mg/Co/Ni transporter MgtE
VKNVSRTEERSAERAANDAMEGYESALDERATDARSTVRTNLLVGLLGGLLVGAVLGGVVPYVAASSTAGRIRVDSSAEYSRKAQWLPVGVGVLVLLATVGLLAATGGLSILTVIL